MPLHEFDKIEQDGYTLLEQADTVERGGDALVEIGTSHLHMGRIGLGLHEIWAGMHGRTGLANAATALSVAGILYDPTIDEKIEDYRASKS